MFCLFLEQSLHCAKSSFPLNTFYTNVYFVDLRTLKRTVSIALRQLLDKSNQFKFLPLDEI